MTKIELIKNSRKAFRNDPEVKPEYDILTLLVGELETASKRDNSEITDEKVVAAAKKLVKSNKETIKLLEQSGKTEKVNDLKIQNACLSIYLPKEMTEEQIRDAIKDSGAENIGQAMKALSSNPDAVYDKGLASKVAKELFN